MGRAYALICHTAGTPLQTAVYIQHLSVQHILWYEECFQVVIEGERRPGLLQNHRHISTAAVPTTFTHSSTHIYTRYTFFHRSKYMLWSTYLVHQYMHVLIVCSTTSQTCSSRAAGMSSPLDKTPRRLLGILLNVYLHSTIDSKCVLRYHLAFTKSASTYLSTLPMYVHELRGKVLNPTCNITQGRKTFTQARRDETLKPGYPGD